MFSEFRQDVKSLLRSKKITYSQLSDKTGIAESSIKYFMCGASDSRRIAEKIADALNSELVYSNGTYTIKKQGENQQ